MALPMAAWRLSYTPGKWLALSGPTSLVIMMAPPASVSQLVVDLWEGTLRTRTPDALFTFISEAGISSMPHFGAFFWDAKGLHGITRGSIQVVDADGEVALEGSGSITWTEQQLDVEETYSIQLEPTEGEVATLPFVVGAALVSSVTLTTAKDQLLRFPDAESTGVLEKIPVLGLRPRQRRAARGLEVLPGQAEQPQPQPQRSAVEVEPADGEGAVPEPMRSPSGYIPAQTEMMATEDFPLPPTPLTVVPSPAPSEAQPDTELRDPAAEAPQPEEPQELQQPEQPEPSEQPEQSQSDLDADTDAEIEAMPFDPATLDEIPSASSPLSAPEPPAPVQALAPQAPAGPPAHLPFTQPTPPPTPTPGAPMTAASASPVPGSERNDPVVVPGTFGDVEDDAGTIFSTGIAATHKPAAPQMDSDPQVLAVPCVQGHANPAGAQACRLCSAPVDSSNPRLVRRPVLAGVNTNHGDFADIVTAVIVGRSPDPAQGPAGSHLMRVPSPGNDISRSHLLVTTREWNVVITDLHSTNGTMVRPVGEPEFELRDGRSVQVEIGTILDLGDGVSLRIEPPRSSW